MSTLPSSSADRQQLKVMIVNITNSYARMDAEKDAVKEILAEAEEKFAIKKKLVSKLAKTMYKRNYSELQSENEDFELLYETLVEGKKTTSVEPVTQEDNDTE